MTFEEPRDFLIDLCGEDLIFPLFTVKGIPGFSVANLRYGETSTTVVETQSFAFQILTEDVKANNIKLDDEFYMVATGHTQKFYFAIEDNPRPDLTGFYKIKVNLIRIAND